MIFSFPPLTFLKLSGPKSTAGEEGRGGEMEDCGEGGHLALNVSCGSLGS